MDQSPTKQQSNPQWDADADRMLRSEKAVHISFMKLAIINLIAIISISADILEVAQADVPQTVSKCRSAEVHLVQSV